MAQGAGHLAACVNPFAAAQFFAESAQALREAMIVAKVNERTCEGIVNTMVGAMPIVVKVMSIAHVYPDNEPELVAALNYSLTACARAAWGTCMDVYEYLQLNKLRRLAAAKDVEKDLQSGHKLLRDTLEDIQRHLTLATFLKTDGVAEALQRAAQDVAAIRTLHAEMSALAAQAQVGSERVRAVAKAAIKKRQPQGLKLSGHAYAVWSVAWSPDGRTLATASFDKTAALWSAATGERLRTLVGHTGWVRSIAWSPDGRALATASDDNTAIVWRAANGKRLRTLCLLYTSPSPRD